MVWTGHLHRQEWSPAWDVAGACPLEGVLPLLTQCQVWSWREMREAFR